MSPHLLAEIWFAIICLEAALYVVLDGGNLGIGVLSLFPQPKDGRALIARAFGPMWDANETWLLIAAATTYGAFPIVYSIALNALYIPAMIFGVGLVVRVVSYEFYVTASQRFWSFLFGLGSAIAVIGQGFLLGGFISGITIVNGLFAGGPFDWLTPLTILFTIGIIFGYMVLGYTRLIQFADYELAPHAFARLVGLAAVAFAGLILAAFFLPSENYLFFARWSTPPVSYFLDTLAIVILFVCALFAYSIVRKRNAQDLYYICISIFALGFLGMIVGVYPYILPPSMSIFDAASSPATQMFMLWGIGPILPIVLIYNFYIHRLFLRDRAATGPQY